MSNNIIKLYNIYIKNINYTQTKKNYLKFKTYNKNQKQF